jgi:hypothetical protein
MGLMCVAERRKEIQFAPTTERPGTVAYAVVVPKKDGGTAEKREIGVFDDSMEGTLTLWGFMISTADTWEISKTVLLLTTPSLKLWRKDVQLTCGSRTLVCVDPTHRDAQWLRTYAQKLLRKPDICAPFPYEEFNWKEALHGDQRMKFTFGDIDKYSRNINAYTDQLPTGQCVGWLNVMITEINVSSLLVFLLRCCCDEQNINYLGTDIAAICSSAEAGKRFHREALVYVS